MVALTVSGCCLVSLVSNCKGETRALSGPGSGFWCQPTGAPPCYLPVMTREDEEEGDAPGPGWTLCSLLSAAPLHPWRPSGTVAPPEEAPPRESLRVGFATEAGLTRTCHFRTRDLGLHVARAAPFRVLHFTPDGEAEASGVKVGWSIVLVGDDDVTPDTDCDTLLRLLREGTAHLPPVRRGLRVDFVDDRAGATRTLHFERRPLGLLLTRDAPARIEGFAFNSYARLRGAQEGWRVARIGEREVLPESAPDQVGQWLSEQSRDLKCWPLRVDFEVGRDTTRTFYFQRQPLGLELGSRAPFRVRRFKLDSYAQVCGVQLGWAVVLVGDMSVGPATGHRQLVDYIEDGSAHLPQEASGIRLDFVDHGGDTRVFYFPRWPLGMAISGGAPPTVEGFAFNSYAEDRGVRKGWQVRRIGGQEVLAGHTAQVDRMLAKGAAGLQVWPLRMEFATARGAARTLYLAQQPLGIAFTARAPFRVSHFEPDSHAHACGAEVGWEIKEVGNAEVTSNTSEEQLLDYLREGALQLPQDERGLRVVFSDQLDNSRVVFFQRRPLGMITTKEFPFWVQGFADHGCARYRNVQVGWTITKISGKAVSRGTTYGEVRTSLIEGSKSLAPWPLRIDFDTNRGAVQTLYFEDQDLGIDFSETMPLVVQHFRPDSYAEGRGVGLSWVVVRIGDFVVHSHSEYQEVMDVMRDGLAHLPQQPRGMRVDFTDPSGQLVTRHFKFRPLGLAFSRQAPITILDFSVNSYAKREGVEIGWSIRRIGKQEVGASHTYDDVCAMLAERLEYLDQWPLRVEFDPPADAAFCCAGRSRVSESKVVLFKHQPLGLVLSSMPPIRVREVKAGGHAESCGVQRGWLLRRVGDAEITQENLSHALAEGLGVLPRTASSVAKYGSRASSLEWSHWSVAC